MSSLRISSCAAAVFLCLSLGASVADAQSSEDTAAPPTAAPSQPATVITAPPTPVIVNVPSPAEAPKPVEGLWLTTDFPALTERVGDEIKLDLRLANKNLAPQRVELGVEGLPVGWTYELDGGGRPVTAAFVGLDQTLQLSLKVTPPDNVQTGSYPFRITGKSEAASLELPITLSLTEAKEAKLTLEPKLPALRGTPRSTFDFQVTAKNDSSEDQLFNLLADAQTGLEVTFSEQYGTQELTSIPIKAGESKDLKVSVKLPQDAAAGQYQVMIQAQGPKSAAETALLLDVTGQPSLTLTGPEGRLSGDATAGQERSFNFTLKNTGTAPARGIKLDATAPSSWKVTFDPKALEAIDPGQEMPIAASITPAEKAIAGDYVVSVRANGDGASANADFRVTVLTSTLWGIAGLGVIGAAVIVLAVAVTRYGRR
jgi:uncharacterized membrane protein